MRNKNNQKGFTLIELLVVIAIIGLLASVVLLALGSTRAKARDAKRVGDIRQVLSALELFNNDCGSYPVVASTTVLGATNQAIYSGTITAGVCAGGIGTSASGTTYMAQTPVAPNPNEAGCSTAQNDYRYTSTATTNPSADYTLTFCLGGQTGGLALGTHTASSAGIK